MEPNLFVFGKRDLSQFLHTFSLRNSILDATFFLEVSERPLELGALGMSPSKPKHRAPLAGFSSTSPKSYDQTNKRHIRCN